MRVKFVADLFNVFNEQKLIHIDQWAQRSGGATNGSTSSWRARISTVTRMRFRSTLVSRFASSFSPTPSTSFQGGLRTSLFLFILKRQYRKTSCTAHFFAVAILVCALPLPAAPFKPKLPEQYRKWVEQDVVYIITDEERKEFAGLATDNERDKFIEDFWAIRNPKHGAERNAYREEHYERIAYANTHFRESSTPGWMTDRGRAWIPSVSRLPSTHTSATARSIRSKSGCMTIR